MVVFLAVFVFALLVTPVALVATISEGDKPPVRSAADAAAPSS